MAFFQEFIHKFLLKFVMGFFSSFSLIPTVPFISTSDFFLKSQNKTIVIVMTIGGNPDATPGGIS